MNSCVLCVGKFKTEIYMKASRGNIFTLSVLVVFQRILCFCCLTVNKKIEEVRSGIMLQISLKSHSSFTFICFLEVVIMHLKWVNRKILCGLKCDTLQSLLNLYQLFINVQHISTDHGRSISYVWNNNQFPMGISPLEDHCYHNAF